MITKSLSTLFSKSQPTNSKTVLSASGPLLTPFNSDTQAQNSVQFSSQTENKPDTIKGFKSAFDLYNNYQKALTTKKEQNLESFAKATIQKFPKAYGTETPEKISNIVKTLKSGEEAAFGTIGGDLEAGAKIFSKIATLTNEAKITNELKNLKVDNNLISRLSQKLKSITDPKKVEEEVGLAKQLTKELQELKNRKSSLLTLRASNPGDEKIVNAIENLDAKINQSIQRGTPINQPQVQEKLIKPPKEEVVRKTEPTPKESRLTSSLEEDTTKLVKSQIDDLGINLERINISDTGKKIIQQEMEALSPKIIKETGAPVTHEEVLALANDTSRILSETVGREETLKWQAAQMRLRQTIAAQAEKGEVTKEFLDNLLINKTIGTDIARKLESRKISAIPGEIPKVQLMLDNILKVTEDTDAIVKAAKGLDLNNPKESAEFYRQFIVPRVSEWIDVLRYNSMLSSPITHLKNIFSNLLNSTIRPVITKAMVGGIDFLGAVSNGTTREQFAGEGLAYLRNYLNNWHEAVNRFAKVWHGQADITNLDLREISLATKGGAQITEKILKIPIRLLEAADQFFMALSESGERASLVYRQGRGVVVNNLEQKVTEASQYGLFRQKLHPEGQGTLLDAIDTFTATLEGYRHSGNPVVSTVSKYTVPFLRTPMNIAKQGIEYSPIGFLTTIGAVNKTEQVAKALIGSGIGIVAGNLIASNRITWGEPRNINDKNAWRANGMQAYSIKIGNKWVSYQYLPPFLSFPLAMVAGVNDAVKNRKLTEDEGDLVLAIFARGANFLADQSYFKSIGDLMSAIGGDEFAFSRLIGNYPQQLIPYRALGGWLERLTDDLQRTLDSKSSFIEKQVQLLMMNVPGLGQKLPVRKSPTGQPIKNLNNLFNSLSPVKVIKQTDRQERAQTARERNKKSNQKTQKQFKSLNTIFQ